MLVPDGGCPYRDYHRHSLYWGTRWPLNDAALATMTPSEASQHQLAGAMVRTATMPPNRDGPRAWLLVVQNAPNNAWANAARASFIAGFRDAMVAPACNSTRTSASIPSVEPTFAHLCTMQDQPHPFTKKGEPAVVAAAAIFVPATSLPAVLPWAMEHKAANTSSASGYELDLMLVPLTGAPVADYTLGAARGGNAWPVNLYALQNPSTSSDDDLTDDDEI